MNICTLRYHSCSARFELFVLLGSCQLFSKSEGHGRSCGKNGRINVTLEQDKADAQTFDVCCQRLKIGFDCFYESYGIFTNQYFWVSVKSHSILISIIRLCAFAIPQETFYPFAFFAGGQAKDVNRCAWSQGKPSPKRVTRAS